MTTNKIAENGVVKNGEFRFSIMAVIFYLISKNSILCDEEDWHSRKWNTIDDDAHKHSTKAKHNR